MCIIGCPYQNRRKVGENAMTDLQEQSRGESDYSASLRAVFRALWLGVMSFDQAFEAMMTTIRRGFNMAWQEGAKECAVLPEEYTPAERVELETRIFGQFDYIAGVLEFIEANSKENGGAWGTVSARVSLWANRYREAKAKAKTMACGDKKLVWRLGKTEQHCKSCLKLNSKVKRASQWDAANIRPQHPDLECGGWRCDCSLEQTDEPMSKGPLPRIP